MTTKFRKTISLGTETTWGFIRHKRFNVGGQTFEAPVALEAYALREGGHELMMKSIDGEVLPIPRHVNGKELYALPGGMVAHAG